MASLPINIFDFEALAKTRLPIGQYDFVAGGATDEITLRRTRRVFESIMLRPRVLVDISERDFSTTVLNQRIAFPIMLAPAGDHGRAHPDAERATVRAAGSMQTLMVLSSGSTITLEEVAQSSAGPIWFQQFLFRDRELTLNMAKRAESSGFKALCISLDSTTRGKRERNIRNNYIAAPRANYTEVGLQEDSWGVGASPQGVNILVDPAASWSDLDWLAARTSLPLVAKGIMTAEDAKLCIDHGIKAIIVSNHGARQLDTTFSTIEVLPEVVAAVNNHAEVYMDGGIRRGTDVVKALALGARAVLIGRPIFWGLAVDGEAGVARVLQILKDEFDNAMAMCGRPNLHSLDRTVLGTSSPLIDVLQDM